MKKRVLKAINKNLKLQNELLNDINKNLKLQNERLKEFVEIYKNSMENIVNTVD
jgi:hypothetical protein